VLFIDEFYNSLSFDSIPIVHLNCNGFLQFEGEGETEDQQKIKKLKNHSTKKKEERDYELNNYEMRLESRLNLLLKDEDFKSYLIRYNSQKRKKIGQRNLTRPQIENKAKRLLQEFPSFLHVHPISHTPIRFFL